MSTDHKVFAETLLSYVQGPHATQPVVQDDEFIIAMTLPRLERYSQEITKSDEVYFSDKAIYINGRYHLKTTQKGTAVIQLLKTHSSAEIEHYFPMHEFNPYIKIFLDAAKDAELDQEFDYAPRLSKEGHKKLVDKLNGFVTQLRKTARSTSFKTNLASYKKSSEKNGKELLKYIDKIIAKHARVMVLRIDLGYKKPKEWPAIPHQISFDEVHEHRKTLLKTLQRKLFKDTLFGYAWKLEYGLLKSYHYHCIFFLDGSKIRQDVIVAKMIGDCWVQTTNGDGLYHNCNAFKSQYKAVGIGLVDHRDEQAIEILKNKVATYLVKSDYYVKVNMKDGSRTFGKGQIADTASTTRGRPRKTIKPEAK